MVESDSAERAWGPLRTAAYRFFVIVSLALILPLEPLTNLVIPWIGSALLGIEGEISLEMTGSGDTTAEYLRLMMHVVFGVVGTALWTVLGRTRVRYERLHAWFVFAVRAAVAASMLGYGAAKLVGGQFSTPDDMRLLQTIGDASPMGLLWTFMGHSKVYSAFTGLAEILGGLLLLSRRTTTLGALVVVGVMSNVVMLNFCYDVPVKLYSTRLLVWALFLVALDGRRLVATFGNLGLTRPRLLPQLFSGRKAHLAGQIAKALVALAMILSAAIAPLFMSRENGSTTAEIRGTYEVTAYAADGQPVPALVKDEERWHRVVVASYDRFVVYSPSGKRTFYSAKLDEGTLELTHHRSKEDTDVYTFELESTDDELRLEGDGRSIVLERFDPEFLLRERGFHWVQEYPYNR